MSVFSFHRQSLRRSALALLSAVSIVGLDRAPALAAETPAPIRAEPQRTLLLSGVVNPATTGAESWLVIANTRGMPQTLTVRFLDPETGAERGRWQSTPIRSNTALTVSVREMARDARFSPENRNALTLSLSGAVTLTVQHLTVRDGVVRAEGGCGNALDSEPRLIGNVFGSSAQPALVSVFEATNTNGAPMPVRIALLDPVNGLPTYSWIESVPGFATRQISIPQLEARIGAVIGGFWSRYAALVESDARVRVRHLVLSGTGGVAVDATAACALERVPEVTTQSP
jgi:hypothetical protein